MRELRSQLETERAWRTLIEEECSDKEKSVAELRSELSALKQNSTASRELPEAADLLNQLKAKRKKSGVTLLDVQMLLELLEIWGDKTLLSPIDTVAVNLRS